MDYLELIARVTSHIPDKGQLMVRHIPSRGRTEMIRKVYEVGPLIS